MTNRCFRAAVYAKGIQIDLTSEFQNFEPTYARISTSMCFNNAAQKVAHRVHLLHWLTP